MCVFTAVCVHLDGLNAEHKFRVWVTILGHTSLHFHFHNNNVSRAANQYIRMISEGSCDTEDWSNDAENSALHHRKKSRGENQMPVMPVSDIFGEMEIYISNESS